MPVEFARVKSMYENLKSRRNEYENLWREISRHAGIGFETDEFRVGARARGDVTEIYDDTLNDPTAAISVTKAADYINGVAWGVGTKAMTLKPSRHVTNLAEDAEVKGWFDYATDQVLYHMNHPYSGLGVSLPPYFQHQMAFGTSGIGVFPNPEFRTGVDDHALIFRNFGVDRMAIDEGKSGLIDYVFISYHWHTMRVVEEFAKRNGVIDPELVKQLPDKVQQAYQNNRTEEVFRIILAAIPNQDFMPGKEGKMGARYFGGWFLDDPKDKEAFFHEEYFKEKPIAVARQVRLTGMTYGRAAGTMLLSTIRMNDFAVGTAVETMEKMNDPALGTYAGVLSGNNVLDSSPHALTVFNPRDQSTGNPVFPIHDVGDPTGILNVMIPYFNEKITTGFYIDQLLDFNTDTNMTATESLQRFNIRGKALAGLLQQQKIELLEPMCRRAVSILMDMKELGFDPTVETEETLKELAAVNRSDRIIPEAVVSVMNEGKPWFELEFNNDLEKMTRTDAIENATQVLNAVGAAAALDPTIIKSVDFYKLIQQVSSALDPNNTLLVGPKEFERAKQAEMQRQETMQLAAMSLEAGEKQANANRQNAEAERATRG